VDHLGGGREAVYIIVHQSYRLPGIVSIRTTPKSLAVYQADQRASCHDSEPIKLMLVEGYGDLAETSLVDIEFLARFERTYRVASVDDQGYSDNPCALARCAVRILWLRDEPNGIADE
jgi:hypothetical protein